MRVLALYLKEFEYKKVSGKYVRVDNISSTDRQVISAVQSLGHDVSTMEYDKSAVKSIKGKFDLILNLCDGLENDNDFQEISILKNIEKTCMPYTGNSSGVIASCCNKGVIKRTLLKNRVLTSQFQIVKSINQKVNLAFPLIVKPSCTDGGVGISNKSVVYNPVQLKKQLKKCIKENSQPALVEEFIKGREFCVPVLGSRVLPPVEIVFDKSKSKGWPGILTYDAKWDKSSKSYKGSHVCVRNKISKDFSLELWNSIESAALGAFKAMKCSAYASVDIRVDENNRVFVIEINPNCWIGKSSDFFRSAKSIGISYPEVMYRIMELGRSMLNSNKF